MIRDFREADAPALVAIFRAAIAGLGPRAYSEGQVAAWSARAPSPEIFCQRVGSGASILVALGVSATGASELPIGYALFEPDGHFDHLYCHPDHSGKGVGSSLIQAVEAFARKTSIAQLFTEASEIARPVFEREGFTVSHRRDLDIDGVAIHNYAMIKNLG